MNIIDHGFNSIEIFQIKDIANCDYAFRGYEDAEKCGGIQITDYKKVYEYDEWFDSESDSLPLLEKVFCKLNEFGMDCLIDFKGHSLAVSDLILVNEESWYYVDDIGFKYLGDFEWRFFGDTEYRVCDDCGAVTIDGYVVHDGEEYYCEECREKHYPDEVWIHMCDEDYECYYTMWC